MLRSDEVIRQTIAPLSAGLLHDVDAYMGAIRSYQLGDPLPLIDQLADALDLAIAVGQRTSNLLAGVISDWNDTMRERSGSRILDLPAALVEQPVVDSSYLAVKLGVSRRSATSIIGKAREYGILRPIGNARRGEYYQADGIIDVLEQISSTAGIRRLMAQGRQQRSERFA